MIDIITAKSCVRLQTILCFSNDCIGFSDVSGSSTSTSISSKAEITPTTSLVVEIPETSENPTCFVP